MQIPSSLRPTPPPAIPPKPRRGYVLPSSPRRASRRPSSRFCGAPAFPQSLRGRARRYHGHAPKAQAFLAVRVRSLPGHACRRCSTHRQVLYVCRPGRLLRAAREHAPSAGMTSDLRAAVLPDIYARHALVDKHVARLARLESVLVWAASPLYARSYKTVLSRTRHRHQHPLQYHQFTARRLTVRIHRDSTVAT